MGPTPYAHVTRAIARSVAAASESVHPWQDVKRWTGKLVIAWLSSAVKGEHALSMVAPMAMYPNVRAAVQALYPPKHSY